MPIRESERARYPANWHEISTAAKERAGWRCEMCHAPHKAIICRGEENDIGAYMLPDGRVHDAETGEYLGMARGSEFVGRYLRVILTTAHLDHQPENNHPSNLRVLCQLHHLRHDREHHVAMRRLNRATRLGQGDLFA
ncbi:hypothetical protein MHL39_10670 [Roseomonas mucosa]|uniref:hypothetical protein n=1 Tax=Roseomonas mucosa TaxID=207340 RepID=UPI001EF4A1B0|nr:hypothetical protein [Roseomonas mucosa]MCG7357101.1 hypothetical protein [Roseomonas mucosa]